MAADPDVESQLKPFTWAADDPLAPQHQYLAQWIKEAEKVYGNSNRWRDIDVKKLPSGQAILDTKGEESRAFFAAAVAQSRHYIADAERGRSRGNDAPAFSVPWLRFRHANAVIDALSRRAMPLTKSDLLATLEWAANSNTHFAPTGQIGKALARYAAEHGIDPDLADAMRGFAAKIRNAYRGDKKLATNLEQLAAGGADASEPEAAGPLQPQPKPAPAGTPTVLAQLKEVLEIPSGAAESAKTDIGPDLFPLRADSPLPDEHAVLTDLLAQLAEGNRYHTPELDKHAAGRTILKLNPPSMGRLLLAVAERHVAASLRNSSSYPDPTGPRAQFGAQRLIAPVSTLPFEVDRAGTFDLLLYWTIIPTHWRGPGLRDRLLEQVERSVAGGETLSEGERYVLAIVRAASIAGPPLGITPPDIARMSNLIVDGALFYLVPGEIWADAINTDITALPAADRAKWLAILKHLLTATAARPSDKWLKTGQKLIEALGAEKVRESLARWLPLVSKGQTHRKFAAYIYDTRGTADTINDENATALRGMLWLMPTMRDANELARTINGVAISAYKKSPGVGPRAVKVGNAAVYALSLLGSAEAVGQLAMLKVRVKFGTAQKEIEKAFTAAAEALQLPRDQIEELGVPTYGLEEVGLRREEFCNGEFIAELRVDGRDVELHWSRSDGKAQKSVPAKVKTDHKEDLKELQTAVKDIAAMLPAQSQRLDSMFLLQKKWDAAQWRERYLDHPLIGTLARRLIWSFGDSLSGIWLDGKVVNVDDEPIDLPPDAKVELWHPIGRPMDDVLAWRGWLEKHQVRQPFKQAHREVYVLTDAERRTNTYSNRFAAHILRQHQFNALCAARGWKNKLRMMVDDSFPPASRELPNWNLRAEFWIEGIGEDYGTDTNESGAYLRVSTDQVRFYSLGAPENFAHAGGGGYSAGRVGGAPMPPLPLDQIPALVFSEILRDVDLFVGVGSVGNDPTWQDGGPEGRFRNYWQSYSFGDLSETAKTRKAVLEKLIPRLSKIASRCTISDKFLIVRGDLRTYKIHLGSGNILMEPNDQYLCIVAARGAAAGENDNSLFLPFEGDSTLSIILSKAFLLAADTRIKDETITRQIGSR